MTKYKVGFFTVRHPEIDGTRIGDSYVTLATVDVQAKSNTEAVQIAKSQVDIEALKQQLADRWPDAKFISYTTQIQQRNAPRTWCRSFASWRLK